MELGYSQNGERETHYTVITNAVGDVVALYTSDGIRVGTYSYDPYGGITEISHNDNYKDTDGILEKNPFRYRSYYYDTETGWYYLNSRYYDPQVKRFVNADGAFGVILTANCINLMQYNLFLYCNDFPIGNLDSNGNIDLTSIKVIKNVFCGIFLGEKLKERSETNGLARTATAVGVSVNFGCGPAMALSGQIVFDDYGNYAIQTTEGGGTGIPSIGAAAVIAYYPNISDLNDLTDEGASVGGSVSRGLGIGYDRLWAGESNRTYIGDDLFVGIGVGPLVEGHAYLENTKELFRCNIYEVINVYNDFWRGD